MGSSASSLTAAADAKAGTAHSHASAEFTVSSSKQQVGNPSGGLKHIDVCNHAVATVSANGSLGLVVQKGNVMDSDNQLSTGSNFMILPSNRPRDIGMVEQRDGLTPGNTQCSVPPNHADHGKALYFVT